MKVVMNPRRGLVGGQLVSGRMGRTVNMMMMLSVSTFLRFLLSDFHVLSPFLLIHIALELDYNANKACYCHIMTLDSIIVDQMLDHISPHHTNAELLVSHLHQTSSCP